MLLFVLKYFYKFHNSLKINILRKNKISKIFKMLQQFHAKIHFSNTSSKIPIGSPPQYLTLFG